MPSYKTPGVYVEEVQSLPPSVAPVATAIPVFIGYTEKRPSDQIEAVRISNFLDFQGLFGEAYSEGVTATYLEDSDNFSFDLSSTEIPAYYLYYQLRMYFLNGGSSCYIISTGTYSDQSTTIRDDLFAGLRATEQVDEPTLILIPDIILLANSDDLAPYYEVYNEALAICAKLQDRFTVIDLHQGDAEQSLLQGGGVIDIFRNQGIGTQNLSYGAAYYPWLQSSIPVAVAEEGVSINGISVTYTDSDGNENTVDQGLYPLRLRYELSDTGLDLLLDQPGNFPGDKADFYRLLSLFEIDNGRYNRIKSLVSTIYVKLPPSGAIAGLYAQTDRTRGVFKSPANQSLRGVIRPLAILSVEQTDELNEHTSGKSINVIRPISGRGAAMVMGGRTLLGNSNEWRYISVRRFFLFAEESIKKAVESFVFEPNTPDTWNLLQGMISNFLTQQWTLGALAGATPEQAFYVNIGLGQTMSPQDVLEGRLVVEIGMAVVRPAEFIILRFMHQLQQA